MIVTPNIITNLQNHFLVATSGLNDSSFERSIVYICTHDDTGTMGVVLNRPMNNVNFTDIADSMGVKPLIEKHQPVIYNGGPVEKNRGFVIHTPEYNMENSLEVGPGITLSATADIVNDIAGGNGPKDLAFCLGYSGWSAGQLEGEIIENSWLIMPADATTLFDVPAEEKYEFCTQKIGLNNINFMDNTIGIA